MNNIALIIRQMTKRWQKLLAIGVMILVVLLIVAKLAYNYTSSKIVWEPKDRETMVNDCIDDLGSGAIRFPISTQEYCECTTTKIMNQVKKTDYLLAQSKSATEQQEELLPIILECYNTYQEAMFKKSKLD